MCIILFWPTISWHIKRSETIYAFSEKKKKKKTSKHSFFTALVHFFGETVRTTRWKTPVKPGLFLRESNIVKEHGNHHRQLTTMAEFRKKNLVSYSGAPLGTLLVHSDLPEMTEEWIRRSCFSQTLQTVELGYGPITAPSVSATRAGSLISACFRYLHWKKTKIKKKLWQPHPASAVSQDLGPIRYTAPYTLTNIQRQIIYDDVKTCPSVWGSADKLCERAPMENKQRSFSSLNPPHPSLKTPLETVSGPHAYEEELWPSSSGEGDST